MSLQRSRRLLEAALRDGSNLSAFAQAKKRWPALAACATPAAMAVLLSQTSCRTERERESLARAIVAEHQERPHALWATVLILACYPMLSRLRHRIYGGAVPADERDQLVVSTFLEVVAQFPLERKRDRLFMHLRQATQRRVFRHVRAEQRDRERIRVATSDEMKQLVCGNGHPSSLWPETRPTRLLDPEECQAQISFLQSVAGDALTAEKLAPVIATRVYGERLRSYVMRQYPDAGEAEHKRLYQRIKRSHSRTLAVLRELLAPHRALAKSRPRAQESG